MPDKKMFEYPDNALRSKVLKKGLKKKETKKSGVKKAAARARNRVIGEPGHKKGSKTVDQHLFDEVRGLVQGKDPSSYPARKPWYRTEKYHSKKKGK